MHQHAVPRQITSFEFKLIGFMSIKQFGYLVLTTALAAATYFAIPIPYFNFVSAGLVAAAGAFFTFYKYNDRYMDEWVKNAYFALTRPSVFVYQKDNPIPAFLADVYLSADAATSATHIDANKKLSNYMTTSGQAVQTSNRMQHITQLIIETDPNDHKQTVVGSRDPQDTPSTSTSNPMPTKKQPTLSGIVKNTKNEPLSGIMVYINSAAGETVRILKTNHSGVFATFHAMEKGTYTLNPKDLNATYFFDTMNINIDGSVQKPMTIYSKEML